MTSNEKLARAIAEVSEEADCQPCRYTGTAAAFALGSYIIYATRGGYYKGRPYQQAGVRLFALASYYFSLARFAYLPPFTHLAPKQKVSHWGQQRQP
ncbi:hypothetical protein AB6A40_002665 [Gnathostoma spinigerum]|uniref:DUF4536 domain-containing protein n=1 Tax=Gnathostoma spinigerum TaxID=75299 RepID=A0ABD6EEX1_9BILA